MFLTSGYYIYQELYSICFLISLLFDMTPRSMPGKMTVSRYHITFTPAMQVFDLYLFSMPVVKLLYIHAFGLSTFLELHQLYIVVKRLYCGEKKCTMPNALDDDATSPAQIANDKWWVIDHEESTLFCTLFHLLRSMSSHDICLLQDPNLFPIPPFSATSSRTTHSLGV